MNFKINCDNWQEISATLNEMPDALIVIEDDRIRFANRAALELDGHVVGASLQKLLGPAATFAAERLKKIQYHNEKTVPTEYALTTTDGGVIYLEARAYAIRYFNKPAILVLGQDITERNKDVHRTAMEQQKQFHVISIKTRSLLVDTLYKPAMNIGGDFYFFHTLKCHCEGECDEVIGVIGDVSGKGTLAAMMISSFEVLFHEAIDASSTRDDLKSIVAFINQRQHMYFEEKYIAALFYHITNDTVTLISCGINHFITINRDDQLIQHDLAGPFLGMLSSEMDLFGSLVLPRDETKRIFLYTDGIEFLTKEALFDFEDYIDASSAALISDLSNRISHYKQMHMKLRDDVAIMCLDLDFQGKLKRYVMNNIEELNHLSDEITAGYGRQDRFNIKLVVTELVTNAYKYGNLCNSNLPIALDVIEDRSKIIIKVTDMSITPKYINVPGVLEDDVLLDENGRGLYILSNICEKLYFDDNHIIAEYQPGGNL